MTQEQKELLLKDLCARLPYAVKIYLEDFPKATLVGVVGGDIILHCDKYDYTYDAPWDIEYTKPYLFPLSSISEDLKNELYTNLTELELKAINDEIEHSVVTTFEIDFYHKYHIDYRGLIPMGLAEDATGKNIY